MGNPGRLTLPALTLCLLAAGPVSARAQVPAAGPERITDLATVTTGQIIGRVADDAGLPVEGVVVSAMGSTSAFAVSDTAGQFNLRQLPPGPYLLRAHREGYLTVRGTIVEVRPAGRTSSALTLRREGRSGAPQVTEASVGGATTADQAGSPENDRSGRDEGDFAWKLRHLKRNVLRDANGMIGLPAQEELAGDPFGFIGRAFESSARAATALFTEVSLDGRVDLLTTGAFDSPAELLQMDRTRSVAFFSLGAPVGSHGDWVVNAAMNQGDLNSWIVSGNYESRAGEPHRYQLGMSYSLQRYEGGNPAALAAVSETARNVGSVFGYDEWIVSDALSIGVGANYAHYDYLVEPSLFSPQVTATITPIAGWRLRGMAARQLSAPGAQEFLPPTRATWLPPQRTFSPLSDDGFRTQSLMHYEAGIERALNGATIGIRAFRQQVDDQMVTIFGLRQPEGPASALGHYYVGTAGNADIMGWGVGITHALAAHVRGSVDYSIATADWVQGPPAADYVLLSGTIPAVLPDQPERIHDVMTSLETEVPQTATRVLMYYRVSNAFLKTGDDGSVRGLDGRFDVQINQALPFMNFLSSQWEMLVAVRNMFHDRVAGASTYDELMVVRPPKRLVGGLTVRF